jgi:hypothetical protein
MLLRTRLVRIFKDRGDAYKKLAEKTRDPAMAARYHAQAHAFSDAAWIAQWAKGDGK